MNMRIRFFSIVCIVSLISVIAACNSNPKDENVSVKETKYSTYGDSISITDAIPSADLLKKLEGKDSMYLTVKGKITEVCKKKGCWMMMSIGAGKQMRVTFKDYAFFVPKDAANRMAFIEGYAYKNILSVEEQQHYAKDAKKSEQEVNAITEPLEETTFEARGVVFEE